MLAAMAFSIIQTLLINQVNPTRFFQAYFEVCAANDGQPPENLEDLLPWNLSQEQKDAWHCPEPFP